MTLRQLLVTAAFAAIATRAHADETTGANSIECKEIIARIVETTNASFDHVSPSGQNVFFRHPAMRLACVGHKLTGVTIIWNDNAYPSNEWFHLLATAGNAVTGVEPAKLEAAFHRCHSAALKNKMLRPTLNFVAQKSNAVLPFRVGQASAFGSMTLHPQDSDCASTPAADALDLAIKRDVSGVALLLRDIRRLRRGRRRDGLCCTMMGTGTDGIGRAKRDRCHEY